MCLRPENVGESYLYVLHPPPIFFFFMAETESHGVFGCCPGAGI